MRLVFLGAPGVGKGTYASRLAPILGIPQISTGDLVRKEVAGRTDLGSRIEEFMKSGRLVPDAVMVDMLRARLEKDDASAGFILDGFPRTVPQAEALETITSIDKALNITLDEDLLILKTTSRRVCIKCRGNYNIADIRKGSLHMPPLLPRKEGVCDSCGSPLVQRDDDTEDVVRERLKVYREQTSPLIEFYRGRGLLVEVEVTGSPDEMVPKIRRLLE